MLTGGMLSFELLYYPSQSLFHNYEFWSRIHENSSDFYTELCFGCLMFALWLFRACWLEQCDPVFCMIRSFIHHCSTATNHGPGFMKTDLTFTQNYVLVTSCLLYGCSEPVDWSNVILCSVWLDHSSIIVLQLPIMVQDSWKQIWLLHRIMFWLPHVCFMAVQSLLTGAMWSCVLHD